MPMKAKRRKTYERFMRKYTRATMQTTGTSPKDRKTIANRRFWGEESIRKNPRYRQKRIAGLQQNIREKRPLPALGRRGHRTLQTKALKARVKRYKRM